MEVQHEKTKKKARQVERTGTLNRVSVFLDSRFRIICSQGPRSREAPNISVFCIFNFNLLKVYLH